MSIDIDLRGRQGSIESYQDALWLLGAMYRREERLTAEALHRELSHYPSHPQIQEFLNSVTGCFALVWRRDQSLWMATDIARSRPLLWAVRDGRCVVSDSLHSLIRQDQALQLDPIAAEELSLCGFIGGDRTLIKGVQSLGPAELLSWNPDTGVRRYHYFRFRPKLPDESSTAQNQLATALTESVRRMLDHAGGRELVIPVSGGVDSRALLAAVQQLGYPRIKTFSFGRRFSRDFRIGCQVAEAYQLPHAKVVYTRRLWKQLWRSTWLSDYLRYAHGGVSVPNFQALPALYTLSTQGWFDRHAIFIPALAGFFPGGCLPSLTTLQNLDHEPSPSTANGTRAQGTRVRETIAQGLRRRKLLGARQVALSPEFEQALAEQMDELGVSSSTLGLSDREQYILASEHWEFQERQPKYIGNSCRYFDFMGYDWWLPMWDRQFVDACAELSFESRVDKSALKGLTVTLERQALGPHYRAPPFIKNGGVFGSGRLRSITEYFLDPFGQYSVVPFRAWLARKIMGSATPGTVTSVLAQRVLSGFAP